jgi:hypothetical protein
LDNPSIVAKQIIHLAKTSSGLSVVSVIGGLQLIYNNNTIFACFSTAIASIDTALIFLILKCPLR